MLSSSHPSQSYDGSRTIVTPYGKTEHGGVSIGSLDLLGDTGKFQVSDPDAHCHRRYRHGERRAPNSMWTCRRSARIW